MHDSERMTCYACGHEYRYLGRGPPRGRCPDCSSHCVSPAGELTVVADVDVSSSENPPQVTILAIDERFRHFLYHFTNDRNGLSVDALQVDGHLVRPRNKPWEIPIPDSVRRTLSQAEYSPAFDSPGEYA